MEAKLNVASRLLSAGCAVALLWPAPWQVHTAGLIVLLIVFVLSWRTGQRKPTDPNPQTTTA